jgi:hypothetical protein
MKRLTFYVILILFALAPLTTGRYALADPPQDEPEKSWRAEDGKKHHFMEHMKKMRQEIKALRKTKMAEALGLDPQKSEQLFAILDKYDDKRHEIVHSMWKDIKELREAVDENKDSSIKGLVKEIEKHDKNLKELRNKETDEVKHMLTLKQQAKYILFTVDFRKEVRKMMAEKRKMHREDEKKEAENKEEPQKTP